MLARGIEEKAMARVSSKALAVALFVAAGACSTVAEAWMSSRTRRATDASRRRAAAGYNVVLEPSGDPDVFDSFRIGNPRVHRYSREDDPGALETEYIMWYHGRSQVMHRENVKLPPLSTGRIGRATSRNGLVWEKDTAGSVSEQKDIAGVSLGLNKESWWGFDTAHVGLGNVLLPMSTPAVIAEGGVYLMYYMGGTFEDAAVRDYTDRELPDDMKEATIQGMKMRIGVALSQDGISWGRVEGDDPSGACMVPYERSDPNQQHADVPNDLEEELYCAWPEVAVNLDSDPSFLMFYSTMTKGTKRKCIAYAVSEDGFRWTKKGIAVAPDADGWDAGGCARCSVIRDAVFDEDLCAWKELDSWKMYYEGVCPVDGKHRIMVAKSKDCQHWTKAGVALDIGEGDAWDCNGVGSPHCVRMDDGTSRMYYTGQGVDGRTAIGVAKLSDGEGNGTWVREQATISFV